MRLQSVFFLTFLGLLDASWTPQLGTVQHPKEPGHWPYARPGDVVKINNGLYTANRQIDLDSLSLTNNAALTPLQKGSIRYPKTSGDKISAVGEIFHDPKTNIYFQATCVDNIERCLHPVSLSANWMTLLRDIIGDLPLGNITLPGSHDSGTEGCDVDSYLVDQNFLFQLGDLVTPQVMVNWSRTQDGDLKQQLEAGFRYYDLRIADCEVFNDTFFWWHGITADEIFEGLQQIADFALAYPEEIIILEFDHFAAPGNAFINILPISEPRMDELSDILLDYLGPVLVDESQIASQNPTMNEILATNRNVIAIVTEQYIRDKSDLFWNDFINYRYSGASNTEDLFNSRSGDLDDFRNYPDDVTMVSGCVTPTAEIVVGGLVRVFGDNPILDQILEELFPGMEIDPDMMSFEGLWVDLVTMARDGVNTQGMHARDPESYSSGASVHYSGTNDMYRYWLARPNKFKKSIIFVDDLTVSSTFVDTAILANRGDLKREVSITYQGTPTHGYYEWDNITAIGGDEAYNCDVIDVVIEIEVSSNWYGHKTIKTIKLSDPFEVVFQEGQYPIDTQVFVRISSQGSDEQYDIFNGNLQEMIETNYDVHIRGTDHDGLSGFGYVCESHMYAHFGPTCDQAPESGYLDLVEW